jgi:hypothetical protein
MKIGILTYTREYANLGTIMQCYSTMRAVQKANPDADVELIDFALSRPSRKPYLSGVSVQSLKNDFERIRKYDRFFERRLRFSKEALCTPDASRLRRLARVDQSGLSEVTHCENGTGNGNEIRGRHPCRRRVLVGVKRAGSIIHAEGVRVGFLSSAPKARRWATDW